jgi:hypothetical protein
MINPFWKDTVTGKHESERKLLHMRINEAKACQHPGTINPLIPFRSTLLAVQFCP